MLRNTNIQKRGSRWECNKNAKYSSTKRDMGRNNVLLVLLKRTFIYNQ